MKKLAVLTFFLALAAAQAAPPRSEARLCFRDPIQFRSALGSLLGELDVASHGTLPDGRHYLTVIAGPDQLDAVQARGVAVEVTWPDIADKFRAVTHCAPGAAAFRDFGYYFTYWEMRDTLYRLLAEYPGIAHLDSSMLSYLGRPLYCLRISLNTDSGMRKPQIFFNGATHAREPMGTHTCIAFASLLCQGYGADSMTTWLVNNREIYIVPVMNPDGYVYNSDSGGPSAYWRKNRHMIVDPAIGVDLNRNYGFKWGFDDNGSSPNPSSETYRGPFRFSEPEVSVIRDFEAAHRFRTGIDFHSYARDNLYCWAYTGDSAPESDLLREVGDTFMTNNGYGNTGQWYYALYPSNGASIDWELSDTVIGAEPKFRSYVVTSELGIADFWYGWDLPTYVDSEVALNIPNCYYMTRVGGAYLTPDSVAVSDSATGNGTSQLDPGETAELWFSIRNAALHVLDTAKCVSATLSSPDTMVTVLTPTRSFPDLPRRTAADNRASRFQVRCSPNAVPGTAVDLRLEASFQDDSALVRQSVPFRIVIGNDPYAVAESRSPVTGVAPFILASPNPTRGLVSLFSTEPGILTLSDISGRTVRSVSLAGSAGLRPHLLDLRSLPAGVYLARLVTSRGTAATRVLRIE